MSARAVLLVLDGMPQRHVTDKITPNLMRLAQEGGMAPTGGRAVLTSATYPNHATLVTGQHPGKHGLIANFVVRDGAIVPAQTVGPATPTLFDLDLNTAAVFGDQNLVGATGARQATTHWPPDGVIPDDATQTTDGYIADESTLLPLLAALESEADLVVAQLNGPDTAGHQFGPDTDDAAAAYHHTDCCLVDVIAALRRRWAETLLVIVSDHDQISLTNPHCIDLWSPLRAHGLELTVLPEGDAAVILGDDPTNGCWLDDIEGIAGHEPWYDGGRLTWAEPGRVFGWGEATLKGIHGGPHTRAQVALVAGGHPRAAGVAAAIAQRPPRAELWAPTIAKTLERSL